MDYKLRLKEIRKAQKITQEELAETLGVTGDMVSNWEREITNLPLDMAFKICRALGCTLDELAGNEVTDQMRKNEQELNEALARIKAATKALEDG